MTITTLSSREFNQNSTRAKQAAKQGPVIITDRGEASHVLLSIEDYRKLTDSRESIVDMLAMVGGDDIEFDPPHANIRFRAADLS